MHINSCSQWTLPHGPEHAAMAFGLTPQSDLTFTPVAWINYICIGHTRGKARLPFYFPKEGEEIKGIENN